MPWKMLIEKLIYLNRCLYPLTQSQTKNVWHLGFVFLAELALRSDDDIETCNIYPTKHSCKCFAPLELHNIFTMLQRHSDARDATTQSRDLKHTKYHHLDLYTDNHEVGVDVFEMHFSILNAVCMGTTYDQAWIVRESQSNGSPSSTSLR